MKKGSEDRIIEEKVSKVNGEVIVRKYEKLEYWGKGGFATCWLCQNVQTKRRYAIKIISKSILLKPKTKQKLLSEIRIHKSVSHKNIVQFYHVFEDQLFVYILLEPCANSNVYELMRKRKRLTIPEVIYYIYQLIQALSYLHNNMIMHRDVKLGNLFIDDKMELKLGDFGLAAKIQFVGQRKRTVCGTPNYIAPEVIENLKGHSFQADIWSTGVIMYIFLTGHPPFETDNLQKTYQRIKSGDYKIPASFTNKAAIDLIKRVLVVDPAKRYTFQQFLEHPFMKPEGGILKTLPTSSLREIPNLKQNEKFSQEEMRMTRVNSIATIRPELQQNLQTFEENEQRSSSKVKKSSSIVNLFKGLLSPSAKMERSNSSQLLKSAEQKQMLSVSKQKEQIKKSTILLNLKKKRDLYIYKYKTDVVISYALTNGFIGTCEANLRILYSKKQNCYFQNVSGDTVRKIPAEKITQDIENRRKKFLVDWKNDYQEPENTKDIVYVKRVLKTENCILFKLSNATMQATFPQSGNILLITSDELILIPKGIEQNTVREKKDEILESKRPELIKCYRIVMGIMNRSKTQR